MNMDLAKIEKRIREIYDEMFDANYYSGAPRIPPHTHNGIDNLQIASGGTPGGSNQSVQFNDSGAFGGDTTFTYDKTIFTLYVPNISNSTLGNLTGDNQQLQIFQQSNGLAASIPFKIYTTGDVAASTDSNDIQILTGTVNTSIGPKAQAGGITIQTGDGYQGARILIKSGTTSTTSGTNGNVDVEAANFFNVNANGISLYETNAGGVDISSTFAISLRGNVALARASSGGVGFGSGTRVVFIANASVVPSSNPTGGGILYVTGGALTYRGSAGTVTTIAPA